MDDIDNTRKFLQEVIGIYLEVNFIDGIPKFEIS